MDQSDKNNINDDSFSGKSTSPAAPLVIHMPVDVRSASLAMLAVLALVYTLHWASPVFIPIVISWVCTYALSPVVDFLEKRLRLSRWIAAGLLLLVLGGAVGCLWAGVAVASHRAAGDVFGKTQRSWMPVIARRSMRHQ